jgi:hypothetical protein
MSETPRERGRDQLPEPGTDALAAANPKAAAWPGAAAALVPT